MAKIKNYLLFLLTFFFLADNSFAKNSAQVDIIAKVNNKIITNTDLVDRYKLVLNISKIKFNSESEKRVVFNQLLQQMIDELLQIDHAKDLNIELDQKKFDSAFNEIAQTQKKNTDQFKNFFKTKSLSYSSFLSQLQSQILWSQIIHKEIIPAIKVSQSEVNELLEFRKIKSTVSKLFLSEIYLPLDYKNGNDAIDSRVLANKLVSELKKGKDFKVVVKQFSRSPTAEFDGEVGWVGEGDVDVKVYRAISSLESGQISDPVLMNDGYRLFKVLDKKTFSTLTDQDLEQIKNHIFSVKVQLMAKSYLMDLRKKAYIEINHDKMADLIKSF